jgi:hypothetical protein
MRERIITIRPALSYKFPLLALKEMAQEEAVEVSWARVSGVFALI